jgi:4-carboxymuconolactone decarboxylase
VPPRVTQVTPGTVVDLAPIEARIAAARGRISPLYRILLNSAPLADGWERLLTTIRSKTAVPARLREMAILRVAVLTGVQIEIDAHTPLALKEGVTQDKVDALHEARIGECFDPLERAVLELADQMTRDIRVDNAVFERLRPHFDDKAMVELVATVAAYNMVTRFLEALEIRG